MHEIARRCIDFTSFAQYCDCVTVCPPNGHVEGKKWGKTLALSPNFGLCMCSCRFMVDRFDLYL